MSKEENKYDIPALSNDEAQDLIKLINNVSIEFTGDLGEFERAIGMLSLGRLYGWRVLVILHNKRTIRKYEDILGIKVRDFFPEEGPLVKKSIGYKIASSLGKFWKVVSGEEKIEGRRDASL